MTWEGCEWSRKPRAHSTRGTLRARLAHLGIGEAVGMKLGSDYTALVSEAGARKPTPGGSSSLLRTFSKRDNCFAERPVWGHPTAAVAPLVLLSGGYS